MKNLYSALFLLLFLNLAAQERFVDNIYGFSMQKPKGWQEANNALISENLKKVDLSEEERNKMLIQNKGTLLLASYYKYKQGTHAGLIPTIMINVRPNPQSNDFNGFFKSISQSDKAFKQTFPDFEYMVAPKVITISGKKCIYFVGKYTTKINGTILKVRTRTYAIPHKNYFFQLNFTDSQTGGDCTTEFDALVSTIKIE